MSQLCRLVLIRHGETVGDSSVRFHGSNDVELSAEGRALMREVARGLRGEVFDLVLASPLRRSWEAASIVVGGAPVRFRARLPRDPLRALGGDDQSRRSRPPIRCSSRTGRRKHDVASTSPGASRAPSSRPGCCRVSSVWSRAAQRARWWWFTRAPSAPSPTGSWKRPSRRASRRSAAWWCSRAAPDGCWIRGRRGSDRPASRLPSPFFSSG